VGSARSGRRARRAVARAAGVVAALFGLAAAGGAHADRVPGVLAHRHGDERGVQRRRDGIKHGVEQRVGVERAQHGALLLLLHILDDRHRVVGLELAGQLGDLVRLERVDQLVGGLVALAALADAAVDDLLQLVRARELIGWLGLEPHAHERCEGFSRGMRQKVALAGALVHDPKLIILDEPLTGLDAGTARQVKDVLRARARDGGTVIMTTHILEVAERMADRIGVIARGRLIAEGTLDDLRRQTGETATSLEDTFLTLVAEQAAA